jgi:hypothetical protein
MQAPAHTTPPNQGIGADQELGLGPIPRPKQQHASSPIAIETLAIGPIAASGLVTSAFQVLQPSQVLGDHRIELRLGHDPLFQLHKPGHGSSRSVIGLMPQEASAQKAQSTQNQPSLKKAALAKKAYGWLSSRA